MPAGTFPLVGGGTPDVEIDADFDWGGNDGNAYYWLRVFLADFAGNNAPTNDGYYCKAVFNLSTAGATTRPATIGDGMSANKDSNGLTHAFTSSITFQAWYTLRIIILNGIEIALDGSGMHFHGLGQISIDGLPLRSARRPMFVDIRTPNGETMVNYSLVNQRNDENGITLEFDMQVLPGGPMEWMVHEVRARYNTADWTASPTPAVGTRLRLRIRPVERRIGGATFIGFSYQYEYSSDAYPIYRILDRGTWELGGRAVGNTSWMRNCFVPCVVEMTLVEQHYSTEWFAGSCTNPSIVQFAPLQTELQGFTFTTAPEGVLVTWPTEVAHVRSLIEKPRDENLLVHWHEHCGDLAREFRTSPVEVLFHPGTRNPVDQANLYHAMKEEVNDLLCARTILPDETGVLYEKDGRQVLWAFRELVLPLGKARTVTELLAGTTGVADVLRAKARQGYVIE